jgi:hypothetical protein
MRSLLQASRRAAIWRDQKISSTDMADRRNPQAIFRVSRLRTGPWGAKFWNAGDDAHRIRSRCGAIIAKNRSASFYIGISDCGSARLIA